MTAAMPDTTASTVFKTTRRSATAICHQQSRRKRRNERHC